jgi:hypothetical protein
MNAQLMIQPSSFIDAGIQMQPPTCDLAMTVIEGMESRSQAGDYTLERFRFNCA